MDARFQIHLPPYLLQHVARTPSHFYVRLADGIKGFGGRVEMVERAPLNIPPDPFDGNFHFVHQGFHRQQNVLNTGPAYIHPYFYADTHGVWGESSLVGERFDPTDQPTGKAERFVANLAERVALRSNDVALPARDAIVIFLQPFSEVLERTTRIAPRDLVRGAVSAAGDTPLVIHAPVGMVDDRMADLLLRLDKQNATITVTDAPVPEVLARAKVTLSYNSPHALEGMCLGIPAVLCAKSDLHENAVPCHDFMAIASAIDTAVSTKWAHTEFVYWFLFRKMLNGGGAHFVETTLRRIRAQGINLRMLGVELPR